MDVKTINDWIISEVKLTGSTNNDALAFVLPETGNKKFCFSAEKQTNGRGRLGRKWNNGAGNLMFSLIVKCENYNVGRLALICGISVLQTIQSFDASKNLALKWPNDVLLERKDEEYMVAGLGVNIKNAPILENNLYKATSLKDCGISVTKEKFLGRFFEIFDNWLEKIEKKEFNAIKETWTQNAKGINQDIEVENIKGRIVGKLMGVDETGALVLQKNNASVTILTGDVHYL